MKPGDIIMIYTDPITMEHEDGQAELIQFVEDFGEMQKWIVKFLDYPYKHFERLIKT